MLANGTAAGAAMSGNSSRRAVAGAAGDALCDPHHEGVRCGVCADGAYRHLDGGCLPCAETALSAIIATGVVALLLAWVLVGAARAWARTPKERRHAFEVQLARIQRKLRILIAFVQVASQLNSSFPRLRFPVSFVALLNWLPVLAFDLFSIFGTLGCVFDEWSFHQELVFSTVWPAATMALLLLYGRLRRGARKRCEYLALFLSFLVFPKASVTVFSAFRYDAVEMGAGANSNSAGVCA